MEITLHCGLLWAPLGRKVRLKNAVNKSINSEVPLNSEDLLLCFFFSSVWNFLIQVVSLLSTIQTNPKQPSSTDAATMHPGGKGTNISWGRLL